MVSDIDLDLVELRCRLRGWEYERTHAHPGDSDWSLALDIDTPEGRVWCRDDGERGGFNCGLLDPVLFTPRLTLADIIAAPGEGWCSATMALTSIRRDGALVFHCMSWRQSAEEISPHVRLDVYLSGSTTPPLYAPGLTTPELLAAHRAVSDLLVRLGEVHNAK